MQERRYSPRSRTLRAGRILFNNKRSVIDCMVRNISAHGACLASSGRRGGPGVTSFLWKSPEAFWLLLLVPLVGAWSVWAARRRVAALRYPVARVLAAGGTGPRGALRQGLPLLRMAAVALAVVALARPQSVGARVRDLSVEGIDIMIALDLSLSMEAADFRPNNRIFVAKETLNEFISTGSSASTGTSGRKTNFQPFICAR